MIIPYQVDVPLERWPISNYLIIAINIAVFVLQCNYPESYFEPYVSEDWSNVRGMFGSMWLHGGVFHLVGNMIFLWIFGNAVCAKVGNFLYLALYLLLGLVAIMVHFSFDGRPAVGASGAINGIVGMYLVFYPINSISCILIFYIRGFTIDSFWMILFWFGFDIWGTVRGGGSVAYMAHLGGFFGGLLLSVFLLKRRTVQMSSVEKSLLEIWGWDKAATPKPGVPANEDEEEVDDDGWTYIEESKETNEEKLVLVDDTIVVVANGSVHFTCDCGEAVKIKVKYSGQMGRCPNCKGKIHIPKC